MAMQLAAYADARLLDAALAITCIEWQSRVARDKCLMLVGCISTTRPIVKSQGGEPR